MTGSAASASGSGAGASGSAAGDSGDATTDLFDLRVVVDRIEGRSVCGLKPGDYFEITESSQLRMPEGGHFCFYALAAALPLLPAKQRAIDPGDWLSRDSEVACPDPGERLIMRIERHDRKSHRTEDLT